MPRINRECREHLSWATKSNLAHKVCIFRQRYPSTQVINMYFNSNSSHAGRKTSVPNIWYPFHPCREGPFPTSLSPLEDLQKVVVRASQGNGVSLWETSNLLKSLPMWMARVPKIHFFRQCRVQSSIRSTLKS